MVAFQLLLKAFYDKLQTQKLYFDFESILNLLFVHTRVFLLRWNQMYKLRSFWEKVALL